MFESLIKNNLMWFPEKEIGFYPVDGHENRCVDYFNTYKDYSNTKMGKSIVKNRIDMVARHYTGTVIDIGIGCGDFIKERNDTLGYDVNHNAINWLKSCGKFYDVYTESNKFALSFWDSIEHIKDIKKVIQKSKNWIFISIPIFKDVNHILKSKHFRKNEHYWYFTRSGIINFFKANGFYLKEVNISEINLGREDIENFVFCRDL